MCLCNYIEEPLRTSDIRLDKLRKNSFLKFGKADITIFDLLPSGWAQNFGEEMVNDFSSLHLNFKITNIKCQDNALVISIDIHDERLNQVLKKYEKKSKETCMICGRKKSAKAVVCKECIKHEK